MDKTQINLERIRACDAGWEEEKHPRSENGQFTSGSGGGSGKADEERNNVKNLKNVAAAFSNKPEHKRASVNNKTEAMQRVGELYREQDKPDFEKNPNAEEMLKEREDLIKQYGLTYSDVDKAYKMKGETAKPKKANNIHITTPDGISLRYQAVPNNPDAIFNADTKEIHEFKGGINALIKRVTKMGYQVEEYEDSPKISTPEGLSKEDRKMARASKATARAARKGRPLGAQ